MLNIRAEFHEKRTFTFRETINYTTSVIDERTNEPTNKPTNKHSGSQYLLADSEIITVTVKVEIERHRGRMAKATRRSNMTPASRPI